MSQLALAHPDRHSVPRDGHRVLRGGAQGLTGSPHLGSFVPLDIAEGLPDLDDFADSRCNDLRMLGLRRPQRPQNRLIPRVIRQVERRPMHGQQDPAAEILFARTADSGSM